jgi:putative transposase
LKKSCKASRRELVDYVKAAYPISLRQACRVIGIRDSVYRYQPDTTRDDAVIAGL